MLGWTREELADASGLSRNTIRNLEHGVLSPRGKTLERLYKAIETAGFEFTDDEGIRRLKPDIKIIQGDDSRQEFFEIFFQDIKRNKGEILAVFDDLSLLLHVFGSEKEIALRTIQKMLLFADMRCLFAQPHEKAVLAENCSSRLTPKVYLGAVSYFVYHSSYIIVRARPQESFSFMIFNDMDLAVKCKSQFNLTWELALPFTKAHTTHQSARA